jgi:hypothetical protein
MADGEVQITVFVANGEDDCCDEKWIKRRYRMSVTDYDAIKHILKNRHDSYCSSLSEKNSTGENK